MAEHSWRDYRKLVVAQLKDHHDRLGTIERTVFALQLKAAAWGALAGLLGAMVAALVAKGLTR